MVITQDCDLLSDYRIRSEPAFDNSKPNLLQHIFFCEIYEEPEIRVRIAPDIWRRVRQNQDERYHCFPEAAVENSPDRLPLLFLDFKRILSFSTEGLYLGIQEGSIRRIGFLPLSYLVDFSHRFFSFHSRVFLPD